MFELQDSDDPSRLALNNHSTTSSLRLKGRGGTLADSDSNLALGKHRSRGYPIDSDVFATLPLHDANHCFQGALDRDWRKQKGGGRLGHSSLFIRAVFDRAVMPVIVKYKLIHISSFMKPTIQVDNATIATTRTRHGGYGY